MTPPEILLKYKETGSVFFLSELEGEYLWAFLNDSISWDDPELVKAVIAEVQAEQEAVRDIWHNLLAMDCDIKQEWIDAVQAYVMEAKQPKTVVMAAILEYLKERQVK